MKTLLLRLGAGLFLVLVMMTIYGQCVMQDLSHDEHQFIAPAVLWAQNGLLPYRDVPLFHQPYLVLLDGFVGKNATSPLLAARLVSGTAASLTSILLFGCTWSATRRQRSGIRLAAAISITLLWLTSPLFLVSSGRTWNHDLPCLLALSALAILLFSKKPTGWQWLAAGLLAGLATGGRLTMAPFAGLLPLTALLWREIPLKNRFSHLLIAGLGTMVALAPSAWLYLQSPGNYLFGNFEFPRLPLLEADNSRILKTMTPWRKIRFFFKEVVASNLPLALAVTFGYIAGRVGILPAGEGILPDPTPGKVGGKMPPLAGWKPTLPSIILPLALVAGAFTPSRYEMQHFYLVAPLAALLAARFLENAQPLAIYGIFALAILGSTLGWKVFESLPDFPDREEWTVSQIHRQGLALRQKVPNGKILTLAPIVALEGGLSIYPQLATGPFGWKFAHLLPSTRRRQLGLLAPADLATLEPPAAILTGNESEKLEKPLITYARSHGYLPTRFQNQTTLWRKPVP